MKNYRFSLRRFFISSFFYRETKIKMTPSCSPCRAGSEHVLFDLERLISKSDLRSGQVKVRSRSDHDPRRSICTSFEAARRAKPFGTICTPLSQSCRDLLAKNGKTEWETEKAISLSPTSDHRRRAY